MTADCRRRLCSTTCEAGFSLIETLASTLLMVAVSAMAMQLWDHSLHLIGSSGRSLTEASMMPLAAALRSDLFVATGVEAPPASWTGSELIVNTGDSEQIRYQLHAGAVTRTTTGLAPDLGSAVTSRRFGSKVSRWQWRMVAPGLIEIRVGHEVHEEPWTAAQRQGPQQQARTLPETLTFTFALRGHDGGMSW